MRRDMFRIAGLTAEAAAQEEVYRRIDSALADRRKLVALMLLRD